MSTATRRAARAKNIEDMLDDLKIDIEDACKPLPLTEQERLVERVRGSLNGITADPMGIASGRAPLALGGGTPVTGLPTPDASAAIALIASNLGVDHAMLMTLLGTIHAATDKAAVLNTAIAGAEGNLVPSTDLTRATRGLTAAQTRIGEIEATLSLPTGTLANAGWQTQLNAALAALAGTPPAPATAPSPEEIALNSGLSMLTRGVGGRLHRSADQVSGILPQAIVTAWRTSRGLPTT